MRAVKFFLIAGGLLFLLLFLRTEVKNFLENSRAFVSSFFDRAFDYKTFNELQFENSRLKMEIEELKRTPPPVKHQFSYRPAEIYSRYPFNERGLIVINLGEEDGMRNDLPVLAQEGILLGKTKVVKRTQSEVLTIFDPSWRSGAAIGDSGTKAVLKGGARPVLEFIPEAAKIVSGDKVVNISPEFPLDLLVGTVKEIRKSSKDVWLTAELDTQYKIENLDKVLVLIDFP